MATKVSQPSLADIALQIEYFEEQMKSVREIPLFKRIEAALAEDGDSVIEPEK